jgi:hypothetical protein
LLDNTIVWLAWLMGWRTGGAGDGRAWRAEWGVDLAGNGGDGRRKSKQVEGNLSRYVEEHHGVGKI